MLEINSILLIAQNVALTALKKMATSVFVKNVATFGM
jgi:hypothetical protein